MPEPEAMPAPEVSLMSATVSIPKGSSAPGCEETNECYLPYATKIAIGGTVIWSNDDTAAHTVTSGTMPDGPDGIFDSSLFMAGTTFEFTFDDAGTYPYFCMVHPWMTGEIIVTEFEEMIVAPEDPDVNDNDMIEEPIVEEPIVEEPIVEEPIVEEPIVEEPIVEEPVGEESMSGPYEVVMSIGSGAPGCEENLECYLPHQVEISPGESVFWDNIDSAAHTVTSGTPGLPDGVFDSGMIMSGGYFEFIFTNPGEYPYYCMVHPWMTGKVIVE
ncbi:MAG: hypothetical protein KC483_05660 [Nitrosarchaeum sp.]|nr:hypothetical protein [Nitrosarchaeum sp.]